MRVFGLVMAIGALMFMGACAEESPTRPDQAVAGEKSGRDRSDPRPGYVDHGNNAARTRQTYRNAKALYKAALRYTADNGGRCVASPFMRNLADRSMIDYLPGGHLFRNTLTGYRTEPQGAAEAMTPGQIGYQGVIADGLVVGFRITAMGATQEDYLVIEYIAPGVPTK